MGHADLRRVCMRAVPESNHRSLMTDMTDKTDTPATTDSVMLPLGRVVATERKPNTPHEFHFWTAVDAPIGIGTIVRVDSPVPVGAQLPRVYGVVMEGFSYSDLQSPLHDVLGHDGQ